MRNFRKRVVVWMTFYGKVKVAAIFLLVIMMVVVFGYQLPAARTWSYWTLPLSGKVIAIDPGHGGLDGGAVSAGGLVEKDINLAISLYLRDYLQQAGALVVMTRETDRDLAREETRGLSRRKTEDLVRRAQLITENKTDLLISIHLNSIPSPRWAGAQTFYTDNNPDNTKLAGLIQAEIIRNLENTNRVSKHADKSIYLLKMMRIPSVLVEAGFLSNVDEARLLSQPDYQQKLAASIYQGIMRYLSGETLPSNVDS